MNMSLIEFIGRALKTLLPMVKRTLVAQGLMLQNTEHHHWILLTKYLQRSRFGEHVFDAIKHFSCPWCPGESGKRMIRRIEKKYMTWKLLCWHWRSLCPLTTVPFARAQTYENSTQTNHPVCTWIINKLNPVSCRWQVTMRTLSIGSLKIGIGTCGISPWSWRHQTPIFYWISFSWGIHPFQSCIPGAEK